MSPALLTELASLAGLVVQEAPVFWQLVEKIIAIFSENRAPTTDEWNAIIDTVKAAGVEDTQIKSTIPTASE